MSNDISIIEAGAGILIGAPIIAIYETVGNTAAMLSRYPAALYHSYSALWRTRYVGPVLKSLIFITSPALNVVAIPAIVVIGSFGHGAVVGFGELAGYRRRLGFELADRARRWITDCMSDQINVLKQYRAKDDEPRYDIKIIEALRGLIGSLAAVTVSTIPFFETTLEYGIRGLPKFIKSINNEFHDMPVAGFCINYFMLPLCILLAVPLSAIGAFGYGAVTGAMNGFTVGIKHSVTRAIDCVKQFRKFAKETVYGEKW